MKRLTLITINYNNLIGLKKTLNSVLNQENVNSSFEHIVVDGNSTDGSKIYLENLKYRYVSEPDKGIYDAFNKGISLAKGDYISFLNSGDEFTHKRVIENYLNQIDLYSNDIIWFQNKHISENGSLIRKTVVSESAVKYFKIMPPHQACLYKRMLFAKSPYNTEYKISGDYDWFIRNLEHFKAGKYIPFATVNQFVGGVSNNGISSFLASNKEAYNSLSRNYKFSFYWIILKITYKILLRCRSLTY